MAKKYEEYLAEMGIGKGMPTAAEVGQQIINREPFKYDINADALYKMYSDKYMAQGQQAMKDTLGKATALTGGYNNSYAQTAAQQAYNEYAGKASEVIPELYQIALNRYNNEGDAMRNNYSMLRNAEDTAYDRAIADRNFDYQKEMDKQSNALSWAKLNEEKRQFNESKSGSSGGTTKGSFNLSSFVEDLKKYEGDKVYYEMLVRDAYNSGNISEEKLLELLDRINYFDSSRKKDATYAMKGNVPIAYFNK